MNVCTFKFIFVCGHDEKSDDESRFILQLDKYRQPSGSHGARDIKVTQTKKFTHTPTEAYMTGVAQRIVSNLTAVRVE